MQFSSIDIKCPACGRLAKFEEPFEFISAQEVQLDDPRPRHRWGTWVVIERFPSQFSWQPPAQHQYYLRCGGTPEQGGYPLHEHGLVHCYHCYWDKPHRLDWPKDAYWQWQLRGQILWAWEQAHAQRILDHIQQTLRPPRPYDLRHIPTHFLTAKVRHLAVKEIEELLTRTQSATSLSRC